MTAPDSVMTAPTNLPWISLDDSTHSDIEIICDGVCNQSDIVLLHEVIDITGNCSTSTEGCSDDDDGDDDFSNRIYISTNDMERIADNSDYGDVKLAYSGIHLYNSSTSCESSSYPSNLSLEIPIMPTITSNVTSLHNVSSENPVSEISIITINSSSSDISFDSTQGSIQRTRNYSTPNVSSETCPNISASGLSHISIPKE